MLKEQLLELLKSGEKLPNNILDVTEEEAAYYISSKNQKEIEEFGIILNEMYETKEEYRYQFTPEKKMALIETASKVKDKKILESATKYLKSVSKNRQLKSQNNNSIDLQIAENCLNILNSKGVRQAEEAAQYLNNYSHTIIFSYYDYIDVCHIAAKIANIETNSKEYNNLEIVPNHCRQGYLIRNKDYIDLCLKAKNQDELKTIIAIDELLQEETPDEERTDCLRLIFNTPETKRELILNFIKEDYFGFSELYNEMKERNIEISITELIKYIIDSKIENEAAKNIIEIIEGFACFLGSIRGTSIDTKEDIENIYIQVVQNIKTISETEDPNVIRLTYNATDNLLNYVVDAKNYEQEQNEELFNEIKNLKDLTPKKTELINYTLQYHNRLDVVIPLIRLLKNAKNDAYAEALYIRSTKILHERYQNKVEDIFKILETIMESDTKIVTDPKTNEEKVPVIGKAIKFLLDQHTDKFSMSTKGKIIEEILKRNDEEFINYMYTATLYLPNNTDEKEVVKIIKQIRKAPSTIQAKIAACYIVYWAQAEKDLKDYIGLEKMIKKITDLDYPSKVVLTKEEEDILNSSGIIFSADRDIIYPDNPLGTLRDDELRKLYLPDYLEGRIPYDFWELFTNGDNSIQKIAVSALDDNTDTTSLKDKKVRVLLKERPEIKRK